MDGRARVTDFGLAMVFEEAEAEATPAVGGGEELLGRTQLTRGAVGTPLYMAPEQWARGAVDARADVYALGCILFEMAAGARPVEGNSLEQVERAHLAGQLRPPPADLPEGVRAFVLRCLALEPEGRPADWTEVEAGLASAYWSVAGREAPAEEAGEQLSREEHLEAGQSYYQLGHSYLAVGKLDVALGYFERACQVARQEHDPALEARGLTATGVAHYEMLDPDGAIAYLQQALVLTRQTGRKDMEGTTLVELANCHRARREFDVALGYFQEAQALIQEGDDLSREAFLWHNMGAAYFDTGKFREAAACHEKSLALHALMNDRRGQSASLGELGNDYASLGDFAKAEHYYRACIATKREIGDGMGEARWTFVLGMRLAEQGRVVEAQPVLDQAEQLFTRLGQHQFAVAAREFRDKALRSKPDPRGQRLTLEELLHYVELACRGHQSHREDMLRLTAGLGQDPQQPPEVQALGQVLRRILEGERRPDLSRLPASFAEAVKGLLKRI
jgi:tetratricopeptide (TPR) repeat protein